MAEGIPFSVADLSASGLLMVIIVTFVWALLSGKIVAKVHYDEALKAKEHWRVSAQNKDETIAALTQSLNEHDVSSETIVKVMSVLQRDSPGKAGASETT